MPGRVAVVGSLGNGEGDADVSQDLGIRQSELVTRLHRAKLALGEIIG